MKNRYLKKLLLAIVVVLPFLFGTVGYVRMGNSVLDSMYATVLLYVMNPAIDGKNEWVEISRWSAPLVTAGGILLLLRNALKLFRNFFVCFHGDATAVYSDNEQGAYLAEHMKHGFLAGKELSRRAAEHVLCFESDLDNLHFYETHKEFLDKHKVYMKLEDMDSFLMNAGPIRYFNLSEITARLYWKQYHLLEYFKKGKKELEIAIIGFDKIGQDLLKFGLLKNIYQLDQRITYHIWGDSFAFEKLHEQMDLSNDDRIVYHRGEPLEDVPLLRQMDRIILAKWDGFEELEHYLCLCRDQEVHLYYPKGDFPEALYSYEKLSAFGSTEELLAEELIKTDKLYRLAKEMIFQYDCLHGENAAEVSRMDEVQKQRYLDEKWAKMDGFTKGSNISSAEYHEIRVMILALRPDLQPDTVSEELQEELSRLEHVRWNRYHYLNYWTYGIPENGARKDAAKRIHSCLVPYEELSREDQYKDFEVISLLLQIMPVKS